MTCGTHAKIYPLADLIHRRNLPASPPGGTSWHFGKSHLLDWQLPAVFQWPLWALKLKQQSTICTISICIARCTRAANTIGATQWNTATKPIWLTNIIRSNHSCIPKIPVGDRDFLFKYPVTVHISHRSYHLWLLALTDNVRMHVSIDGAHIPSVIACSLGLLSWFV